MSLDISQEFIEYIAKEQNLSSNTLENYKTELTNLTNFANTKEKSLLTLDRKDLMSYIEELRKSNSTINLNIIRAFYKFLADRKYLNHNPALNLENSKAWQTMSKFLNKTEIAKLFAQPDSKSDIGIRDIAMLQLLYITGIKASELLLLNLKDLDLEKAVLIYLGKTNKEREIKLNEATILALKEYLPARERLLRQSYSDLLFVNNYGKEMSRQQFWRIIVDYGEKAGLGHITPHTLSHSFATYLLEHGADDLSIDLLGSDSTQKTQYTYVTDDRIKSIYEKFHPRSR